MNIDDSSAVLQQALRELGEALGKALADGITRGVQEGLSRSLDLDGLSNRAPVRAAEGFATGLSSPRRRGGRPKGEQRACRVEGCEDPARSRGLCSRHYQQELRREKTGEEPEELTPAAPPAPVEAKPPIIRKKADLPPPPAPVVAAPVAAEPPAPPAEGAIETSAEPQPPIVAEAAPEPVMPPLSPSFTTIQKGPTASATAADAARRIFGGKP